MTTDDSRSPRPGAFPTTHWSVVINAGRGSEKDVRRALESLCGQYWYPLYKFIRRQGRTHHQAEDCTQAFLAKLLASDGVARARPERGRFRTFLLASLRNFMVNDWQRERAEKRGGGKALLPLEFEQAGERFDREPVDPGLTPEQEFDRNFARDMISNAIRHLRLEYEASGRGRVFAALRPLLLGNSGGAPHDELAPKAGLTTRAFTVALERLRRRFGERLRRDVAQTVSSEAEVDAELRHLIAAWSSTASAE
jgi:RNA polymerase sigma-70 factor (ECF subfamily)